LERVGQIAGEATVVFAGHDPVESTGKTKLGLVAELTQDATGAQFVVRVEPE
jgi:hypothetical protein